VLGEQGEEFEVIGDEYRCFAKGRLVEIPERSFIRPWPTKGERIVLAHTILLRVRRHVGAERWR
jgi:hypothetical protein